MYRPSILRIIADIGRLLGRQPSGYTLRKAGPGIDGRIRGDLIPLGTMVIVDGGRHFVRTGEIDDVGFEVYAEGHQTFEYRSVNS